MKLERKRQEKLTLEAQLFWVISGIPASWKKSKTSKVSQSFLLKLVTFNKIEHASKYISERKFDLEHFFIASMYASILWNDFLSTSLFQPQPLSLSKLRFQKILESFFSGL